MQGKASKIELLDTKIYGYLRGFKSPPRPPYCDSDRTSLFQRTMEKTMEFCAGNSRGQSSAFFNILDEAVSKTRKNVFFFKDDKQRK